MPPKQQTAIGQSTLTSWMSTTQPQSAATQHAPPGNKVAKPNEFDRLSVFQLRQLLDDHHVAWAADLRKPALHQLVQQGSGVLRADATALQKEKVQEYKQKAKDRGEQQTAEDENGDQGEESVLDDAAEADKLDAREPVNTASTSQQQKDQKGTKAKVARKTTRQTAKTNTTRQTATAKTDGQAKKSKTPLEVRNKLCMQALIDRKFEWVKPEPDDVFSRVTPDEGKTLAQTLRASFQEYRREAASETDGEIERQMFPWLGDNEIIVEDACKVDMDIQDPFKDSDLEKDVMTALKPWEDEMKLRVAMQLNRGPGQQLGSPVPKDDDSANDLLKIAYRYIRDNDNNARASQDTKMIDPGDEQPIVGEPENVVNEWVEVEQAWNQLADHIKKQRLRSVEVSWSVWARGKPFFTSLRNRYACQAFGILRAPSPDCMYVAFDKNGRLIVFLYPNALLKAYGQEMVDKMTENTRYMYEELRTMNAMDKTNPNKRWVSHQFHEEEAQGTLRSDNSGTDYYGCWHQQGHNSTYPAIEMSDGWRKNDGGSIDTNFRRQCLLQFLRHTGGTMAKLIDLWFEVWEPELFRRYQKVYDGVSDFVKLPPTNKDRPETWCYRANLVNRHTDEHSDDKDWKKGMAALMELGELEGGAMCLKQLRLKLEGYHATSLLLIRGSEVKHYTGPWKGTGPKRGDRYVFLHGTHETVRESIEEPKPFVPAAEVKSKKRKREVDDE